MTDDAALLKAILEAPDDDALRLAYARWSQEQGDEVSVARAELIRAQIGLEQMDPEVVRTGGAYVTEVRVKELIDRYGAAWAGALAEWVEKFYFVRGFVGWMKLSARSFLDHGERILALAPVQHVDLTAVRDVDESLFDSPLLDGIRSLSMNDCGLYDLHVQMLAASEHVTNLRWLSVADNHLTLAAAEAIAASPHLRNLRFAEFGGNVADPVEQLGVDSGIVVVSWMPPAGKELEERFGPQAWLHREIIQPRFGRSVSRIGE
jgi:uncharacterized protein (TIGR02996 family)